jgi:retron-type reverse transcriptase
LDYLLSAVAKRFGLKYSRYADDMTFSSMQNVYQPDSDFIKELRRIVAEQGFHIKESKTRLQKEGYRQEVTGLLVNQKVNVSKRYIKQLRMWLYYWENYGYEKAQSFFMHQYLADKGHCIKGKPDMVNVIDGKLNYLKMVKGDSNDLYLKLRDRFNILTNKESFISKVLTVWETNGIESAMEFYYSKNEEHPKNNSIADIEFTQFDISMFLDNQST